MTPERALWLFTNTEFTPYCWTWKNKLDAQGRLKFNDTPVSPKRLWYQVAFGAIADDLAVLRHCAGDARCVRPDHHHVGTRADAGPHALRLWRLRTGGHHPKAKVTPEIVAAIREAKANGASYAQLAKASGLSRSGVQHIVRGSCWRDVEHLNQSRKARHKAR